jgi:hypothetical protein
MPRVNYGSLLVGERSKSKKCRVFNLALAATVILALATVLQALLCAAVDKTQESYLYEVN